MGQKWLSWMPGAQKDHTESHGPAQHRGPDGPTGCHLWAPQARSGQSTSGSCPLLFLCSVYFLVGSILVYARRGL